MSLMLSQSYSHVDPHSLLNEPGVLAVVSFNGRCEPGATPGVIPTGITSLSGHTCEIIRYGNQRAERGLAHDCHWSRIDDVLCVATWLSPAACADIEGATCEAYQRLFIVMQQAGFAHPFRIWNFIPRINEGEGDAEEYKKFCVGRQRAFDQLQLVHRQYPAASALGHHGEGAVIYLLAHAQPGQHHENSRQDPAYRYPRQYGPCSPSFARATSVSLNTRWPAKPRDHLFISGTASILGHDTRAVGDLSQQVSIILENIQHLVSSVNTQMAPLEALRVYLRRAEDYSAARGYLEQMFSPEVFTFLHADICRANLLVEIEAASRAVDSAS